MPNNTAKQNVFDKEEVQNIRKMAIKILDVLPESIMDEFEDVDEYALEGAITISKRAFEVLTDEELEAEGIDLDVYESIRQKMEIDIEEPESIEKCFCGSALITREEDGSVICPHCEGYMVN